MWREMVRGRGVLVRGWTMRPSQGSILIESKGQQNHSRRPTTKAPSTDPTISRPLTCEHGVELVVLLHVGLPVAGGGGVNAVYCDAAW